MRVLIAQINPTIGDLEGNAQKIIAGIHKARQQQADIVLFPELALTGYPPEDLLLLPHFIEAVEGYWDRIAKASTAMTAIVGTPRSNPEQTEKPMLNSAAVFQNGVLLGFQDKMLLLYHEDQRDDEQDDGDRDNVLDPAYGDLYPAVRRHGRSRRLPG